MEKKPQRIPRNKNANGSLIVHKLIQCEAADAFDVERDDLIMLVLQYAETEEDFKNNKLTVKQFVFPRHNAHILATGILNIAAASEKEGSRPANPFRKN